MAYKVDQELAQIPRDVELPTALEIAKSSISNTISAGAVTAGVSLLTTKLDEIYHPVSQACLQSTEAANTFSELLLRPDLLFSAVYNCGPDIASHPMIQEAMQNAANAGLIVGTALLAVAGIRALSTWFELKLPSITSIFVNQVTKEERRIKAQYGTENVTPIEHFQDHIPGMSRIKAMLGTEHVTSPGRYQQQYPEIDRIEAQSGHITTLVVLDMDINYCGVHYATPRLER